MARLHLALASWMVMVFLAGCVACVSVTGPNHPITTAYIPPRHLHGNYYINVVHETGLMSRHVAWKADHRFEKGKWPVTCAIGQNGIHQPTDDYLKCSVCGKYINESVISWENYRVARAQPDGTVNHTWWQPTAESH